MSRSSYTYAILEISQAAYDEISRKLLDVEQEDRMHDHSGYPEVIDMQGIALAIEKDPMLSKPLLWGKHCRGAGCDDFNEQHPSCICKCAACKPPESDPRDSIKAAGRKLIQFINQSGKVRIEVGPHGTSLWDELCEEFNRTTERR